MKPRAKFALLPRCMALAALAGLLGGCVAAVLPVIAGGAIASKTIKNKRTKTAPVQRTGSNPVAAAQAIPQASAQDTAPYPPPATRAALVLSPLQDLPPPDRADGSAYGAFAAYALEAVREAPGGGSRASAVLTDDATLASPQWRDCGRLAPAVIVDLDPGRGVFDPAGPGSAAAGLSASLAALRSAGITVMWASEAGVDKAQAVYARLAVTGLDPDGTDRLMLRRKPEERKQVRRRAATRDWCILAIAADQRGDFDELFDYLRDPAFAIALDPLFGAGWFIAPPPIHKRSDPPILTETNPP